MRNKILINKVQQNNKVIEYLHPGTYEWSTDISCDFAIKNQIGVLYLSLKFHREHQNYIKTRLAANNDYFPVNILLLVSSSENDSSQINELTQLCITHNITVVLAFNTEESARWIQSMYQTQNSTLESLKTEDEANIDTAINALHCLGVSHKEAEALLLKFGSLEKCLNATQSSIAEILSPEKAKNFCAKIQAPF